MLQIQFLEPTKLHHFFTLAEKIRLNVIFCLFYSTIYGFLIKKHYLCSFMKKADDNSLRLHTCIHDMRAKVFQ